VLTKIENFENYGVGDFAQNATKIVVEQLN